MKRIILTFAAVLMAATTFAQQQGDLTLGGSLDLYHLNYGSGVVYSDNTFKVDAGYFLTDNLALVAGIGINCLTDRTGDSKKISNIPSFAIGARYYLPITGKFFWTPAVISEYELERTKHVVGKDKNISHDSRFTFNIDFAAFEYMVNNRFSVITSIGECSFGPGFEEGASKTVLSLGTAYTEFGFRFWL